MSHKRARQRALQAVDGSALTPLGEYSVQQRGNSLQITIPEEVDESVEKGTGLEVFHHPDTNSLVVALPEGPALTEIEPPDHECPHYGAGIPDLPNNLKSWKRYQCENCGETVNGDELL